MGSRQHLSPRFPQLSASSPLVHGFHPWILSWFLSLFANFIGFSSYEAAPDHYFIPGRKKEERNKDIIPIELSQNLYLKILASISLGTFFCKVSLILFFLFLETLLQQSYKSRGGGETALCKATCISAQSSSQRMFLLPVIYAVKEGTRYASAECHRCVLISYLTCLDYR